MWSILSRFFTQGCVFCKADKKRAKVLLAHAGAYICNDCVVVCSDVLEEEEILLSRCDFCKEEFKKENKSRLIVYRSLINEFDGTGRRIKTNPADPLVYDLKFCSDECLLKKLQNSSSGDTGESLEVSFRIWSVSGAALEKEDLKRVLTVDDLPLPVTGIGQVGTAVRFAAPIVDAQSFGGINSSAFRNACTQACRIVAAAMEPIGPGADFSSSEIAADFFLNLNVCSDTFDVEVPAELSFAASKHHLPVVLYLNVLS